VRDTHATAFANLITDFFSDNDVFHNLEFMIFLEMVVGIITTFLVVQ
jgi:hypothetical protein